MSQATQATVSRKACITAYIVAAVSLLALLICVFRPPGKNGESSDLDKLLGSEDAAGVAVITKELKFELFFTDGSPMASCGRREGDTTKVPAACGIKGTLENHNTFVVGTVTGSDCDYGTDGPGNFYSWHTKSPYKNKGPCHSSAHPGH